MDPETLESFRKHHKPDNSSDFRNYIGKSNTKMEYSEETLYNYNAPLGRMDFATVANLIILTDKGITIKTSSTNTYGISELRDAYLKHKSTEDREFQWRN